MNVKKCKYNVNFSLVKFKGALQFGDSGLGIVAELFFYPVFVARPLAEPW